MRLIKLSTDEFASKAEVQAFFESPKGELRSRTPQGTFLIPIRWIAKNGLQSGETILFAYEGRVLYVAQAKSGRLANTGRDSTKYAYCFEIDMDSLWRVDFRVDDLEGKLALYGITKSLSRSRGWPRLPSTDGVQKAVDDLCRQAKKV